MSKGWWIVVIALFLVGAILVFVGFSLFANRGFLENLLAEAIGLIFGLALVIWFIEGPVLTRERRLQAMLAYKRRVFQAIAEIGHIVVREMVLPLANDFDPPVDFYAYDLYRWSNLEPFLRDFYGKLWEIPDKGLPPYAGLSEADVESKFSGCESMYRHIKKAIDSSPGLKKYVLSQDSALESIAQHIDWSRRLGQLEDMAMRYRAVGELGTRVLDLLDTITPLPEESKLA